MSIIQTIKKNLKGLWIYSLTFLFLFDLLLLRKFSHSGQTFFMFFVIPSFILGLTLLIYLLIKIGVQYLFRQRLVINAAILFVAAEISFSCLFEKISFFGLFDNGPFSEFPKGRDFALSLSSLLGCVAHYLTLLYRLKRQLPPT